MSILFSSFLTSFKNSLHNFNGDVFLLVFALAVLALSNTFGLGAGLGVGLGVGLVACLGTCSDTSSDVGSSACLGVVSGVGSSAYFFIGNILLLKLFTILHLAPRINAMLHRKDFSCKWIYNFI